MKLSRRVAHHSDAGPPDGRRHDPDGGGLTARAGWIRPDPGTVATQWAATGTARKNPFFQSGPGAGAGDPAEVAQPAPAAQGGLWGGSTFLKACEGRAWSTRQLCQLHQWNLWCAEHVTGPPGTALVHEQSISPPSFVAMMSATIRP